MRRDECDEEMATSSPSLTRSACFSASRDAVDHVCQASNQQGFNESEASETARRKVCK